MKADGAPLHLDGLVGARFPLECKWSDTAEYLKDQIEARTWMTWSRQCLLYQGRELQEGSTLSDYNIRRDSALHLIPRQVGGKPVIYVFPQTSLLDVTVPVSLVPQRSFSHIYPLSAPKKLQDGRQHIV